MSYTVEIMTTSNHDQLELLRDYLGALQATNDETAAAVAEVVEQRKPQTEAAESAVLLMLGELRDNKVPWETIAEGAGYPSAAAAKVAYQRLKAKHGLFKQLLPDDSIDDEGSLTADEAAKALGIPTPTFRDRVRREDPATMAQIELVASWHKGKPAKRYRLIEQ